MVLIPKVISDNQGIVLLDFMWKVVEAVIDTGIKIVVQLHDVFHCFFAGEGTGTAIMEIELAN